jgi:hypothetical protein
MHPWLVLPQARNDLRHTDDAASLRLRRRLWWNWQTRYFEVVVGQPVQVQVLLSAPFLFRMNSWCFRHFISLFGVLPTWLPEALLR